MDEQTLLGGGVRMNGLSHIKAYGYTDSPRGRCIDEQTLAEGGVWIDGLLQWEAYG